MFFFVPTRRYGRTRFKKKKGKEKKIKYRIYLVYKWKVMFGFGHLDGGSMQLANISNPGKSLRPHLQFDIRKLSNHTVT